MECEDFIVACFSTRMAFSSFFFLFFYDVCNHRVACSNTGMCPLLSGPSGSRKDSKVRPPIQYNTIQYTSVGWARPGLGL